MAARLQKKKWNMFGFNIIFPLLHIKNLNMQYFHKICAFVLFRNTMFNADVLLFYECVSGTRPYGF